MTPWERYLALDREKRDIWDREQTIWMAEQQSTLQDQADGQHATEEFTGAAWDTVTSDYAAWLCGHRIGWAPTSAAANDLIREQVAREIAHRTIPT